MQTPTQTYTYTGSRALTHTPKNSHTGKYPLKSYIYTVITQTLVCKRTQIRACIHTSAHSYIKKCASTHTCIHIIHTCILNPSTSLPIYLSIFIHLSYHISLHFFLLPFLSSPVSHFTHLPSLPPHLLHPPTCLTPLTCSSLPHAYRLSPVSPSHLPPPSPPSIAQPSLACFWDTSLLVDLLGNLPLNISNFFYIFLLVKSFMRVELEMIIHSAVSGFLLFIHVFFYLLL